MKWLHKIKHKGILRVLINMFINSKINMFIPSGKNDKTNYK